ncbi:MAG: Lcl C-terminal domain-containing protein [Desulfobulbaceae bacterium]
MGLFKKLGLAVTSTIDWEMTPEYTFGTFESWGGKERVRSAKERVYYFFIDNWGDSPRLCLMERGIKHARVAAEILAPEDMVRSCVDRQGKAAIFEQSFAIDSALHQWLLAHVIETEDDSKIIPIAPANEEDLQETGLPPRTVPLPTDNRVTLPAALAEMSEEDVCALTQQYNLFDSARNTGGKFANSLVDNRDNLTVSDLASGLMWQRGGLDIMSNRMLRQEVARLNKERFAGFADWRIPSVAEALSLMEPVKNRHGQHVHVCFSPRQPFIFVAATRTPGGYWFVDYKQGSAYWASGTNPGGFARLCREDRP